MTRKRKQTVVQALEEPMQAPSEILSVLTVNNDEPKTEEVLIESLNKGKLQALISKFPIYPCISERHPEKIEAFLNAYTITLQELRQTIEQIS